MGPLSHISNLDDLLNYLRDWTTFGQDRTAYDTGGIVVILLACLDNLKSKGIAGDYESLGDYMTKNQRSFFLELAEYIREYEAKGLGDEFEDENDEETSLNA